MMASLDENTNKKSSFLERKKCLLATLNIIKSPKDDKLESYVNMYDKARSLYDEIIDKDEELIHDIEIAKTFVELCHEIYYELPKVMQNNNDISFAAAW